MARRDRAVERALHRWTEKGLVSEALGAELREEARAEHDATTLKAGQLFVALAGAVALFLAGAIFVSETWPLLSEAARTGILAAFAGVTWIGGRRVARRDGWRRIGEVLQVAALSLGAFALGYSEQAWESGSTGARIAGAIGLAVPIVLGPAVWRGSVGLVAAHTALALVYAALFLDRAFSLDSETILWILDGLLLAALALLWLRLRERWDRGADHELAAFVTGSWAGLVLVLFTGGVALDWAEHTVWALDLWWLGIVALTLWGAARSADEARRDLIETHMALCVPLGTALFAFSAGEALDLPDLAWAGAGAAVAVAGLRWALAVRNIPTITASTASLVTVLWVYAFAQSNAAVAAIAMVATAAILFRVAARIRAGD
ncbi:DUF2157 domain-containing protein [Gaopeijia maritima]|uniref:DUF2157 domain-containing protein n=1 Tax=Gaopeijia maritima TaxID=3119007 RepID=A0ABU9E4M2_9BACT